MTDHFALTPLVPVSQWVYNLYVIRCFDKEGGRLLRKPFFYANTDGERVWHEENIIPGNCEWISWEVAEEKISHPRQVGSFYGRPVVEGSIEHARGYAERKGLVPPTE